jgi:hypothetical protein
LKKKKNLYQAYTDLIVIKGFFNKITVCVYGVATVSESASAFFSKSVKEEDLK